jgi:ADP-ribose pyrophosphatase YjhB (NUDIX family)
VIEFFAILLPGALLTYLLADDAGPALLGNGYRRPAGTEGWILFLFSSYLLGHFVFLLGSWLLDDYAYDRIRKGTHQGVIKTLAEGNKKLPLQATRWLADRFIKAGADHAVRHVVRIKDEYMDRVGAREAINAFQWSKARLALEHRDALSTVERFEADSKFFRSLVIVLGALIPWSLFASRSLIALVSLVLLLMAFWRYVDQRVKATSQAYWYIVTLEANAESSQRSPQVATSAPSHAGGVVFRKVDAGREYLLVAAKKEPRKWVLPKGHLQPAETTKETAVREVYEETGIWARIIDELSVSEYEVQEERVRVQIYVMEAVEEGKPAERRRHVWLPLDKALEEATHDETRELLRSAAGP